MTLRNLTAPGLRAADRAVQSAAVSPHLHCAQCASYLIARRAVIARALGEHVSRTPDLPAEVLGRLLAGVHDRHTQGLPILPNGATR